MNGLIPEIGKIAAYAKGERVTKADIDAVAAPVLEAQVFEMTGAVSKGSFDRAAEVLGTLLKLQEEPIMLLALIGKELPPQLVEVPVHHLHHGPLGHHGQGLHRLRQGLHRQPLALHAVVECLFFLRFFAFVANEQFSSQFFVDYDQDAPFVFAPPLRLVLKLA